MNKSQIDTILSAVAAKNNVSLEEVYNEIAVALLYARHHQTKVSQKFWTRFSHHNEPSVYQVFHYILH